MLICDLHWFQLVTEISRQSPNTSTYRKDRLIKLEQLCAKRAFSESQIHRLITAIISSLDTVTKLPQDGTLVNWLKGTLFSTNLLAWIGEHYLEKMNTPSQALIAIQLFDSGLASVDGRNSASASRSETPKSLSNYGR